MATAAPRDVDVTRELERVVRRRYFEALAYPWPEVESRLFADSPADIGQLRKLRRLRCPAELAARILL